MYQRMIILGNLGGDPEMRYMADGTAVTNFSVAVNSSRREGDETVKETVWFRCSAWGKRGEAFNEWFKKGQPVLIEGRLRFDPQTGGPSLWTGREGDMRATFEITVDNWNFAGKNEGGQEFGNDPGSPRSGTQAAVEEDEIPF